MRRRCERFCGGSGAVELQFGRESCYSPRGMMRSTGGEQIGREQLVPFEGLVHSTARMYYRRVWREEDDLAQELRIVVWRAVRSYDPQRSRLTLERYVFQAVTNKIKDYKRDAAREVKRQVRYGVSFVHIEDTFTSDWPEAPRETPAEHFDALHHHVEHEDVFGEIDGSSTFRLPSSVTERECAVLLLLMMDYSRGEIAAQLRINRVEVSDTIASLRQKFADWRPSQRTDSSPPVSAVPPERTEGTLAGSRAA